MAQWTDEWPEERGWYWFYGWRSKYSAIDNPLKPDLYAVKVRRSGNDHAIYIADGNFLHKQEGARGLWRKMDMPELPAVPNLGS